MLKHPLNVAFFVGCLVVPSAPTFAATVFVQLFPLTGEIRIVNRGTTPLPIALYRITSNSGALISSSSVWKSITENYDAPIGLTPGNGFVDPDGEWVKIASTSIELAEGALDADGGNLLVWRPVSLGRIWNTSVAPVPDLDFEIFGPDQSEYDVFELAALDGDYFADDIVNQTDYGMWRQFFGSTSILFADGNIDGTINAADYVVWRDNVGKSISGFSAGSGLVAATVATVPEPASAFVLLAGTWHLFGRRTSLQAQAISDSKPRVASARVGSRPAARFAMCRLSVPQ